MRTYEINKLFIIIVPISKMCCKYMKKFKGKLQNIIPPKRINVIKCNENGDVIKKENTSNFDSIF